MKYPVGFHVVVGAMLLFHLPQANVAQTPPPRAATLGQSGATASSTSFIEDNSLSSVLRSRVDMVLVPVSVTDKRDRSVIGLTKDNFLLLENNQPQALTSVSLEDEPVSIGIVLDTSDSMVNKVDRVKIAVHQLLANFNSDDECFLITFSDRPHPPVGFTSSPELIENEILWTAIGGYTALVDSINLAIEKMHEAKYSRRAIVVISDGGDNHSRGAVADLVRNVEEGDVLIYSVGLYDYMAATSEEILGPVLLDKLSKRSGGAAFDALDGRGTIAAVGSIISQVRTRYLLSYYPRNKPDDGRWHTISVRLLVPHRSHLHVHAKAGYYALAQ